MNKLFLIASLSLSITACGGKKDDAGNKAPAPAAPSTAPVEAAKSAEPKKAPAALSAIKLDAAGAGWKGFSVQGPAGAEVSENGAGGVVLNFPDNTMLQLVPAEGRDVKAFKAAIASGAKSVTYPVDTADELVFITETDLGGGPIKGYGFSVVVSAGGKKVDCGSTYDDDATANRMKAICKSLAKS